LDGPVSFEGVSRYKKIAFSVSLGPEDWRRSTHPHSPLIRLPLWQGDAATDDSRLVTGLFMPSVKLSTTD